MTNDELAGLARAAFSNAAFAQPRPNLARRVIHRARIQARMRGVCYGILVLLGVGLLFQARMPDNASAPMRGFELVSIGGPAVAHAYPDQRPIVVLETTLGRITLELFPEHSPLAVAAFLGFVRAGHYDGVIFDHANRNQIFSGMYYPDLTINIPQSDLLPPIPNESMNGLKNERGTIAFDNVGGPPVSPVPQYFNINVRDNPWCDYPVPTWPDELGCTVFGRVIEGLDLVDRIAATETSARTFVVSGTVCRMSDMPIQDIVITSARER